MLQPARTKFRKQHKGRIHGPAKARLLAGFRCLWAQGAGA